MKIAATIFALPLTLSFFTNPSLAQEKIPGKTDTTAKRSVTPYSLQIAPSGTTRLNFISFTRSLSEPPSGSIAKPAALGQRTNSLGFPVIMTKDFYKSEPIVTFNLGYNPVLAVAPLTGPDYRIIK